ncbi:MAG: polysaccharide pyruvyl transferase family protein [Lachnospiraceae bacterium]|nr:polysaccharide pyruvyl transferase family protein [Lachnospiraceae bacterium]
MKVGIISINIYTKSLNFACPLHTWAFQQFLLKNGIDCTVISYKPNYYDNFNRRHPYDYYKKKYEAKLAKDDTLSDPQIQKQNQDAINYLKEKMELWEPLREEREIRYDKFQHFINENYIRTKKCYDSDLLEVEDPGFDCYICATDVIWKNTPNVGYDRGFFLGSTCMENKKKIAYAASRGIDFAKTPEETEQFFHYLKDFDSISVREKTLKQYIEQNSDIQVPVVLDPVLLHDRTLYEKISVKPPEEHYVLLYYVMEQATETIRQAALYAKAHHQKIIEITDLPVGNGRLSAYPDVDYTHRYAIGVEEWLGYLLYADCIFTNSFHACCFSILFEKQFFAGHRNSEKVSLILDAFELSHRKLVSKGNPVENPPAPIDYDRVRTLLAQKRKESSDFILEAIHQAETAEREVHDYSGQKKKLTYRVQYNSGKVSDAFSSDWNESEGILKKLTSGSLEYIPHAQDKRNDGNSHLAPNQYHLPHHRFIGWRIRIQIDHRWFWIAENGKLLLRKDARSTPSEKLHIFQDEETLPYLPVNHISYMVAEAIWEPIFPLKVLRKLKHLMEK